MTQTLLSSGARFSISPWKSTGPGLGGWLRCVLFKPGTRAWSSDLRHLFGGGCLEDQVVNLLLDIWESLFLRVYALVGAGFKEKPKENHSLGSPKKKHTHIVLSLNCNKVIDKYNMMGSHLSEPLLKPG